MSESDDIAASIALLSPEKQDRVASMVVALAAEPDPPAPLTSAEVAAAYEALNDKGKKRIVQVLENQRDKRP